jgi:hypothetical protein
MIGDTHGRWPVVGAVMLLPVTAAAYRRREFVPLAALLWHQTEEWVWPGRFLPWINREVIGSSADEFPLGRRLGFAINVVFGWGSSIAAAAGPRAAAPAALLYTSHLGNAALHLSWAARNRRYDPGSVTALLALTPVAITGMRELVQDPRTNRRAMRGGVAGGLLTSVVLMPLMKLRLRYGRAADGRL